MSTRYSRKLSVVAIGMLSVTAGQWALAESSGGEHDHDHGHEHSHDHGHEQSHDHGHEQSHDHSHHEHGHDHAHDRHHDEAIQAGHFADGQVKDRSLADWEGDWQSVYPYLQDGTLDAVMAAKAADSADKTADEYKAYYQRGYRTEVERIVIDGNTVTFHDPQGARTGEYAYDGYEILTYEAGNRGVRYIFERQAGGEALPGFIQFSDHAIYPTDAGHFHLYWGDDRQALLEEVENWPTYFPSAMEGQAIAADMMAH